MGGVTFPQIGELSYLLTLPGHGFYWFQLPAAREETGAGGRRSHAGAAACTTAELDVRFGVSAGMVPRKAG